MKLSCSFVVVNVGTSAQLAMILSSDDVESVRSSASRSFEIRPFVFANQFIGVAASLSGCACRMFVRICLVGLSIVQNVLTLAFGGNAKPQRQHIRVVRETMSAVDPRATNEHLE